MQYKTTTDKEYMSCILDTFAAYIYEKTADNFNKRSSVTRKGGRPYLYSPREIGEQMVIYFRKCVKYEWPFTITGLCLSLGISRQGLLKMERSSNDEFVDIVKKGKGMVEFYCELQVHVSPNPSFPIFVLKNMGWSDKLIGEKRVNAGLSARERAEAIERINNFSE